MKRDMNYVYWYHLDTHTDPTCEGYVGVTNWLTRRRYQHRIGNGKGSIHLNSALKKYGERVTMTILKATPDREEALLEELYWRPTPNIGWNICAGGGDAPDCTGRVHTKEVREKISESNRRTKATKPKSPSIFKGVTDRWSDGQKAKIGEAHKGKTITAEHRRAITEKVSGAKSHAAKPVHLVHKDRPSEVLAYPCIKVAADELGLGYQAIRSLYQQAHLVGESKGPNRAGWVVLLDKDLASPEATVKTRLLFHEQWRKDAIALREANRAKQKALK